MTVMRILPDRRARVYLYPDPRPPIPNVVWVNYEMPDSMINYLMLRRHGNEKVNWKKEGF